MSVRPLSRRLLAATAALGLSALGVTAASTAVAGASGAPDPSDRAEVAACADAGSPSARVKEGYAGTDPNSLTRAESLALDRDLQARMAERGVAATAAAIEALGPAKTITVDVHVHLIRRSDGSGGATRAMVDRQIAVLNAAYSGRAGGAATPFRFRLASLDVSRNTQWYNWGHAEEFAAKRALHRGGQDDLNLYVTGFRNRSLLGYAHFPGRVPDVRDGVVVFDQSLPGGSVARYNEGDTGVHEIGHWLGLQHTFQNGCATPGDGVDDTPYQNDGNNIFFCNNTADTCPRRPGLDPVHNYMSYGNDPCLDQFTPGQADRMLRVWLAYRAPSV